MTAPAEDQAFYTPKEVASVVGLHYHTVLKMIRDGLIPAKRFGTRVKVPARWVLENRGVPERVLQVVPDPAPVATADYGPLASVLEILGQAMVQAAAALRGAS